MEYTQSFQKQMKILRFMSYTLETFLINLKTVKIRIMIYLTKKKIIFFEYKSEKSNTI